MRQSRTTTISAAAAVLLLAVTAVQAQPTVYVLAAPSSGLAGQHSLVVINGATNRREAQIPLGRTSGSFWDGHLAISQDGERIYVANTADDTISIVSTATNTVIDTLPRDLIWPGCLSGCSQNASLAVSPDGRLLYVSSGFTVIDLASRTRLNRLVITAVDMVLSPDGSRLFVRTAPGANGPHDIEVFDAPALASAATKAAALIATVTFPVGVDDRGATLDMSQDGRFLYAPRSHGVGNYGVAVVDTTTNTFVTETPTPGAYASSAASNGTTVYVTGRDSTDVLYRLSPTTHAALGTTSGVSSARDVAFSSDGSRAYVAAGFTVQAIDTATHARVGSVSTTSAGAAVALAVRGAFTATPGPPGVPANLRATVSGNTITLNWNVPSSGGSPTSYTLVGRLSAGGPVLATVPMGAGTSFSVAAPNGTFVLTVRAANASGTGPESAAVTVTVPQAATPPGPPSALAANVSGTTATFTWNPPSSGGAVGNYVLLAGLTPAFSVPYTSVPLGAATSFAVAGVPVGTYYVRVLAQNTGGTSPPSNEVALTVAGLTAPGAPTLNVPMVSGSTVSLSWTAGSGGAPAGYTLAASATPGGAPIVTVPLGGTSVSFAGVPSGTYYLRLTASNAAGASPPSAEVTLTVP